MPHNSNQGFALIAAIFILVVLGLLSAFVMNLSALSGQTVAYGISGARATFAARSGLEWGMQQVLATSACPSDTTLTLTQVGLQNYGVEVSCSSQSYTEGVNSFEVFQLAAIARHGTFGDRDYVQRQMQISVTLQI